jgi:hypothetical protein
MHAIIQNKDLSLDSKRDKLEVYLRRIGAKHVSFHTYDEDVLLSLHEIFTCENSTENKSYCSLSSSSVDNTSSSSLLIPHQHLLTGEENDKIYYTRLSDELLRHRRVHLFMFYPEQYLNINDQEYQIAANEFVTSKSVLSTDYFKELKPHTYKQYGQNVPFENSDPARPFIRNPVKWSDEFDKIELAD